MRIHTIICLGILAAPLALSLPAFAQTVSGTPPTASVPSQPPQAGMPAPGEEHAEHQKLREERQMLRLEHEKLQSERDTLKIQCMDAKGQERSECAAKWQDLKARQEALHQRMEAFKAEEEEHHGSMHDHNHHALAVPNNAPPVNGQAPVPPTTMAPANAQN